MAVQMQRRQASPARWQVALQRAIDEGVEVRQLSGSGAWIAASGTDASVAYEVDQFGGCTCAAAALGNDPCCKHMARLYFELGLLDFDPEPTPAAPALSPSAVVKLRAIIGETPAVRQHLSDKAAAIVTASPATCRRCKGKQWELRLTKVRGQFAKVPCPACCVETDAVAA